MQPEIRKSGKGRWIAVLGIVILAGLGAAWWVRNGGFARPKAASVPAMAMPMPGPPPATGEASATEVLIPAESLERLHLEFAQVSAGRLSTEVRVPGTVQPNAYSEVHVTPLVGGVITQVFAELGQTVKRGQTLAQVFSNELTEARMQFATVSAELEAEHKKLERTQELVRLGAASRQELETVEASHRVHAAHVEAARQKLALLGLSDARIEDGGAGRSNVEIPAPIEGVVTSRNANLGQVVAVGQDLFTITDLATVWIEGSLFEKDFAAVRVGSEASITAPAYPGRAYRGSVGYIDPRVDSGTRTSKIRVEMSNPGQLLRLGMFVDMSLGISGGAMVALVPKQAVQSIGSTQVVYLPVEAQAGLFLERTIETGEESGGGIRVVKGLRPGEKVVTEGSFLLRAEALRQHPR